MKNKALQYFSAERLERDASLSKDEIARFLNDFQSLAHGTEGKRKLISLRVPENLMRVFKDKAKRNDTPYQTQIVALMRHWVAESVTERGPVLSPLRIITGGQTGVDRAALDACMMLKLPTGGWCPKGRLAEDGVINERYPLIETVSERYEQRTEWNIRDSDGTLILSWGAPTDGTLLTMKLAKGRKKPLFQVDLERDPDSFIETVRNWIRQHSITVLNVAGPRASYNDKIYSEAYRFSCRVLRES